MKVELQDGREYTGWAAVPWLLLFSPLIATWSLNPDFAKGRRIRRDHPNTMYRQQVAALLAASPDRRQPSIEPPSESEGALLGQRPGAADAADARQSAP